MSIKLAILEKDGVEYITPTEMEGAIALLKSGLTYGIQSHVTEINTTSATDVTMPNTSLTLTTGKYLILSYLTANLSTNSTGFFSLYLDGIKIPNTEQQVVRGNNALANSRLPWGIIKEITIVNPTSQLDIRWRRQSGTLTSWSRFLLALKVKED
jgi:hypothetical protein